jgi:hypothetical protein
MMRAERELMESIKLNESNVAAANVRIKQLKVRWRGACGSLD